MTLIGQHAKSGDYDSDNSREGVKNGNVKKTKECIFSLDFFKTNDMEPLAIEFMRAPCR